MSFFEKGEIYFLSNSIISFNSKALSKSVIINLFTNFLFFDFTYPFSSTHEQIKTVL